MRGNDLCNQIDNRCAALEFCGVGVGLRDIALKAVFAPKLDFLFEADATLADALTVSGMAETAGVTFPPKDGGPAQRIDHCFVTYDLVPRVKSGWIDEDAPGSDHQPVWAEFRPA